MTKPHTLHNTLTHKYGNHTIKHHIKPTNQKQPPPPIVEILWHDAKAIGDTWDTEHQTNNQQPEPSISIGYLWDQTETHTTLVNLINTNHIGGGIVIPNGCIQHINHTETNNK